MAEANLPVMTAVCLWEGKSTTSNVLLEVQEIRLVVSYELLRLSLRLSL